MNKRVQSYLFKWERMLLDHLRRIRNASSEGDFLVLVQFTPDRIIIREVSSKPNGVVKSLDS